MKFLFLVLFCLVFVMSVLGFPGKPAWAGNPHQGGGSSATSQAQSQALNVNIIANPDGTFAVQQSAAQAEAQAAAQSGAVQSHPGQGHGNKGGNKGNKGGSASAAQSQSQTVNVNINKMIP
uniref:CSON004362 protein n=1 Tax=Culicoides sonorensis TaxID=179676 RepID=A0A336LT85_CULSO